MSCPFPGMDPYLEGDNWTDFHLEMALGIKHALVKKLQPPYAVFAQKYFMAESEEDLAIVGELYPDVGVIAEGSRGKGRSRAAATSAPVQVATVMPHPVPHFRVVIRDLTKRRLVTVIELLSPTNKSGEGRAKYLKKRRRILVSSTHLIEIDLLRKGRRVPWKGQLPAAQYYVFLSRAQERPIMDVWPIPLHQSLPTIPIPLLAGDPDVSLDLQTTFTTVYEQGGYRNTINYKRPPDVPVAREESTWINQRLAAAGLR